jgi:hypothetical protein
VTFQAHHESDTITGLLFGVEMTRRLIVFSLMAAFAIGGAALGRAQTALLVSKPPDIDIPARVALPRMAPELAFQVYTKRAADQSAKLTEYTDRTIVEADLPDTKQHGEYELLRAFKAPKSLSFATIKFTGDAFVKTNVITRLLQSEVDHVEKGDPAATAISDGNYKINYKGQETVNSKLVHVFQLKPRRKVSGLIKGKIYLDAYTGSLVRAEGSIAKSPSFFVKKVDFTQDFQDINGFTVPTELRSVSKARIIGRAVVRIFHRGYEFKSTQQPEAPVQASSTLFNGSR